MKNLTFIFFIILFSPDLICQEMFQNGFIITNQSDTVSGLIHVKPKSVLNSISFVNEGKEDSFTANEIQGFLIDNKLYRSVKLQKNDTTKVFLECLILGKASLYYSSAMEGEKFYIEKDGEIAELNNAKKSVYDQNGNEHQVESRQYIGVLKSYFNNSSIVNNVDRLVFSKKNIAKITKDYNLDICKETPCSLYEQTIKKHKYYLGLEAELGMSNIELKASRVDAVLFSDKNGNKFSLSAFVRTSINSSNKLFGQLSVGFSSYSFEENGHNSAYPDSEFKPADFTYDFSYIKTNLSLIYRFGDHKIKPAIQIGGEFNIMVEDKGSIISNLNKIYKFDSSGPNMQYEKSSPESFFMGVNIGPYVELSGKKRTYFLGLNYKMLNHVSFKSSGVNFSLGCYF